MAQSGLTATSTSWVQAILLPQPPKVLGLHARATAPSPQLFLSEILVDLMSTMCGITLDIYRTTVLKANI